MLFCSPNFNKALPEPFLIFQLNHAYNQISALDICFLLSFHFSSFWIFGNFLGQSVLLAALTDEV